MICKKRSHAAQSFIPVCCSEKRVRSDCMSFCSFDKLASGSLDFGLAYSCIDVLDDIIACASGRPFYSCFYQYAILLRYAFLPECFFSLTTMHSVNMTREVNLMKL